MPPFSKTNSDPNGFTIATLIGPHNA